MRAELMLSRGKWAPASDLLRSPSAAVVAPVPIFRVLDRKVSTWERSYTFWDENCAMLIHVVQAGE